MAIKNWQWGAALLLLILAPLNSKLAGACWLALCVLGVLSYKYGSAKGDTSEFYAAKVWLLACLSALILIAIPQFYWGDSWDERHAEFRLLLGACGLLGLVHYASFTHIQLKWLGYALVLATWSGFGLMIVFGSVLAPTNQIPWGASMSLLVCVVLALTLSASSQPLAMRLFYASGVLAGIGAVLLSQARGSYGIVFWVGGVFFWHYVINGINWRTLSISVLTSAIAITLLVQIFPQLISVPTQRIQLAVADFSSADSEEVSSLNTSVGTRLYLWKRAVEEAPSHLFLGVGREGRMVAIQRWGVESNLTIIKSLGHMHNNYVHSLFDFGLFGLASFLSLFAGLVFIINRLRKDRPFVTVGLAGIFFMHATSSLTNVNFAHNYYPTMLSVAVSICLLLGMNYSDEVKAV